MASIFDSATGRTTSYYYDLTDRLMKYAVTGSSYKHSVGYKYDISNNLLSLVEDINDTALTKSYTYDQDNRVTSVTTVIKTVEGGNPFTTTVTETYTYDAYGRVEKKEIKNGNGDVILMETYGYVVPSPGKYSTQVASMAVTMGSTITTYTYTYDGNGNILSVNDGTRTVSYAYDSANQLTRESNPAAGKTWMWEYDNAGNITAREQHSNAASAWAAGASWKTQ